MFPKTKNSWKNYEETQKNFCIKSETFEPNLTFIVNYCKW
jgi:hypothetical protein